MNEDRLTANVVKRLLDESASQVPAHIQDGLNAAISKSVQLHAQKYGAQSKSKHSNAVSGPVSGLFQQFSDWLNKPALSMAVSALFIAGAVFGVAQFGLENSDTHISETADLDAAILSDDLPPDAYLDPGFINYATELQKNNVIPAEDGIEQWMDSLPADFTTSI
ncbi:MAG: DUF3619 family protein [Burkholderiales bacterium]|jgi:hypothetical protein|uniref:DUF3619 family protein n=1 Tax=Limnobacter sp. TaxID=2003368 RepID=UPI0039BC4B14|nr:DUF3619 family protein [Burkholderiales bacterium]